MIQSCDIQKSVNRTIQRGLKNLLSFIEEMKKKHQQSDNPFAKTVRTQKRDRSSKGPKARNREAKKKEGALAKISMTTFRYTKIVKRSTVLRQVALGKTYVDVLGKLRKKTNTNTSQTSGRSKTCQQGEPPY